MLPQRTSQGGDEAARRALDAPGDVFPSSKPWRNVNRIVYFRSMDMEDSFDMRHLSMQQLLAAALRDEPPAHISECAFCGEQYDLAVDYLRFEQSEAEGMEGMSSPLPSAPQYRLAAQTAEQDLPMFRLRRTWYLDGNSTILRVIEDTQRKLLTGFLITEPASTLRRIVRFDGIERSFSPDKNGVFEIGSANIDIEPMNVVVD